MEDKNKDYCDRCGIEFEMMDLDIIDTNLLCRECEDELFQTR